MFTYKAKWLGIALLILTVPALAPSPAAAQTAPYAATVVVSPVPGNPTESGEMLIKAMASFNPQPSSSARWLVKIEPGIYDLGATPLQMLDYVDIEGSGVLATILRGHVGPNSARVNELSTDKAAVTLNQGLVHGANNAEIRELTIECAATAGQPACMAMLNEEVSPRISNLRIVVTAPSAGSHWGIRNYEASPELTNVEIQVGNATAGGDNYGIVNAGDDQLGVTALRSSRILIFGSGTNNWALLNRGHAKADPISNSTLSATGGLHARGIQHTDGGFAGAFTLEGSTVAAAGGSGDSIGIDQEASGDTTVEPRIRSSKVSGDTAGIQMSYNNSVVVINSQVFGGSIAVAGGTVKIGGTFIQSGTVFGATSATCAGVWDGAFNHYDSDCP